MKVSETCMSQLAVGCEVILGTKLVRITMKTSYYANRRKRFYRWIICVVIYYHKSALA